MARLLRAFLLALALLSSQPALAADETELRNFAILLGLEEVDEFVAAVESIREHGDLPESFLRKHEARDLGWRPGRDLCEVAPGATIGGDRFQNRERRLPLDGRWREADLDFDCGRRGARRLVYSDDGRIFVTLDHYETFYEVPR